LAESKVNVTAGVKVKVPEAGVEEHSVEVTLTASKRFPTDGSPPELDTDTNRKD
jgi:hypothetical protein